MATEQAQGVIDSATEEANQIKEGAISYTDGKMEEVMILIEQALSVNEKKYTEQQDALNRIYETLKSNRAELYPVSDADDSEGGSTGAGGGFSGTGELNLDMM